MNTVLFVHGTGVRNAAYKQTLNLLATALEEHRIAADLARCEWGDVLGALPAQRSIPGAREWSAKSELAEDTRRWRILIDDPFVELRVLAARSDATRPLPPGAAALAKERTDERAQRVLKYTLSGRPATTLTAWGFRDLWPGAWREFTRGSDLVRRGFGASGDDGGEPGRACARAITATLLICAAAEGRSVPNRDQRDEFVTELTNDMGLLTAGLGGFLKGFFARAALHITTRVTANNRIALTDSMGPIAGDILLYQARGGAIREFIKQCTCDAPGDVYLLGHSLGGIACVDLLVGDDSLGQVRGLITVGTQAPLFHEVGALVSLESGAIAPALPPHFPRWLNIYDDHDFLSYLARPIFGGRTEDLRVNSGQPFPLSHGAYWSNSETWDAIKAFVA